MRNVWDVKGFNNTVSFLIKQGLSEERAVNMITYFFDQGKKAVFDAVKNHLEMEKAKRK
jgi:hypothetical protein